MLIMVIIMVIIMALINHGDNQWTVTEHLLSPQRPRINCHDYGHYYDYGGEDDHGDDFL